LALVLAHNEEERSLAVTNKSCDVLWRTLWNWWASNYLWPPYVIGQAIYIFILWFLLLLVHGQVTIIFVVSVGLSVCLFVCLFVCPEFFSAVFDPISIKLGHMLYVWV